MKITNHKHVNALGVSQKTYRGGPGKSSVLDKEAANRGPRAAVPVTVPVHVPLSVGIHWLTLNVASSQEYLDTG